MTEDEVERALIEVIESHKEGLGLAVEPSLFFAALEYLGGEHGRHGERGK